VEPVTTVGTAAVVAYLSKDGVAKLLGPTADYLGGELKELIARSQKNVASVFSKAERKAAAKLDQPGAVNPRVFKHVIDEARFCENELMAEYFGGILASARTDEGVDDRGVYYAQIAKSLSVYQLRCHYLFYYVMWFLAKGLKLNLNDGDDRQKLTVVIPASVYEKTFSVSPNQKETAIVSHALAGLVREGLIQDSFQFSSPDALLKVGVNVKTYAFLVSPTIPGLELFLWAHGKGDEPLSEFLDLDLAKTPDLSIVGMDVARLKNG